MRVIEGVVGFRTKHDALLFSTDPAPPLEETSADQAGTEPGPRVHPEVVEAMREIGIELGAIEPRRLTEALAAEAQLLVTMGCGEACPVVPGLRRDDWPLPDPKGQPRERVRAIRDDIRSRVAALIAAEDLNPRSD